MKRATTTSDYEKAKQHLERTGMTGLTTQELADLWGITKKAIHRRFQRQGIKPFDQVLIGNQYHGKYRLDQIKKIVKIS